MQTVWEKLNNINKILEARFSRAYNRHPVITAMLTTLVISSGNGGLNFILTFIAIIALVFLYWGVQQATFNTVIAWLLPYEFLNLVGLVLFDVYIGPDHHNIYLQTSSTLVIGLLVYVGTRRHRKLASLQMPR